VNVALLATWSATARPAATAIPTGTATRRHRMWTARSISVQASAPASGRCQRGLRCRRRDGARCNVGVLAHLTKRGCDQQRQEAMLRSRRSILCRPIPPGSVYSPERVFCPLKTGASALREDPSVSPVPALTPAMDEDQVGDAAKRALPLRPARAGVCRSSAGVLGSRPRKSSRAGIRGGRSTDARVDALARARSASGEVRGGDSHSGEGRERSRYVNARRGSRNSRSGSSPSHRSRG
jgi:hypothetical protein